ncbi:MAG: O-antigen ligase family protein, partial [Candidatus Buchananbacteria bacterium]|nr:O-antigen ligase family protein [Candidatus Buchananbacteria bacterium]
AISFLVFDFYLLLASVLAWQWSSTNWLFFNFLKLPILNQLIYSWQLFLPFVFLQLLSGLGWYLKGRYNLRYCFLIIIFIFEFFIFLNTQTRGAVVGFFIGLLILVIFQLFFSYNVKIKKISAGLLLALIISPFLLVSLRNSEFIKNSNELSRLASISINDVTAESRLLTWQASWQGWTESFHTFLIGVGPENYYYIFNQHFPVQIYKDAGSRIWFDKAHNLIFDIAATTGLFGLLSYGLIIFFACKYLIIYFKKTRHFYASFLLVSLLAAYLIQNLFVFDTLNSEILFYLLLGFIAYLYHSSTDQESAVNLDSDVNFDKKKYYSVALICIATILIIFGYDLKTLKANHDLFLVLTTRQSIDATLSGFNSLINQTVTGKFEAREQLYQYALGLSSRSDVVSADLSKAADLTIEQLKASISQESKNISPYLWLGTFYNRLGRINNKYPQLAIPILTQAIALSPTRPQVYFERGLSYAITGRSQLAVADYQKGLDLAPWVLESHWRLITLGVALGDQKIVDEQLIAIKQAGWPIRLADYDRLAGLYLGVKNYDKIIELYSTILDLEPTGQRYLQLAEIYAKNGQNNLAKQTADQALGLDSSLTSQVNQFLADLKNGELVDK